MNANQKVLEDLGIVVGSTIKIIKMLGHPEMKNKTGIVRDITKNYQIQGTWGNITIVPSADTIVKIK